MNDNQHGARRSLTIFFALFIPFACVVALMVSAGSGQLHAAPTSAKIHNIDVMPLQTQTSYHKQKLAYGRVEASKVAQAGFELSGTVNLISVDEGDIVEAGQLLATLDTQRLNAKMVELDASLTRAESEARLANLSLQRVVELVDKNLESKQRLDEVTESTKAAEAQVTEIKARQKSLLVEIAKSKIVAPFTAQVLARPVDPGTVVAAGQTILQLQQINDVEARIALSSDDALVLRIGAEYPLQKGPLTISAKLKTIAHQRRLDTRTIDAIFSLHVQQGELLPGDLVALSFDREIAESGFWVPRQALTNGIRGLWTLYTVAGAGEQHVVSKSVELLYVEKGRAFVRGGLKSTDLLVINGTHRLVPDQVVNAVVSNNQHLVVEQ